jgi:phosphatidate phosphatase APP1
MASTYRQWQQQLGTESKATFHYLSASPWHLLLPLHEFLGSGNFPITSMHLRDFDKISIKTLYKFLTSSPTYKLGELKKLMTNLRGRRFLLVGDATEKDPEIYGKIHDQFAQQIQCIFIRRIPTKYREDKKHAFKNTAERFEKAFESVPKAKYFLFEDGRDLANVDIQTCQPKGGAKVAS